MCFLLLAESIGSKSSQRCVRAYSVVVKYVLVDAGHHLPRCDVLVDVDIFVFQVAKKTFCANIVQCLAFAVHGYPYAVALHQIQVGLIGEVAALIRIDDLRFAIAEGTPETA